MSASVLGQLCCLAAASQESLAHLATHCWRMHESMQRGPANSFGIAGLACKHLLSGSWVVGKPDSVHGLITEGACVLRRSYNERQQDYNKARSRLFANGQADSSLGSKGRGAPLSAGELLPLFLASVMLGCHAGCQYSCLCGEPLRAASFLCHLLVPLSDLGGNA
ncbi:hypothetical protein MMC07_002599 [Pseudocyphellaria aurata]|nr:hypothetical protein [Pseudocyphellaria aurata]